MRYPIAIEPGSETTAFGAVIPDLPGCFSAGDTLDAAFSNAEEAAAWIDATIDAVRRDPAYGGWAFGVIAVDPAVLDDTAERVNITLPRRVLQRLDAMAKANGDTRSGTIAQLTLHATAV